MFEIQAYHQADILVTISEHLKDRLIHLGVDPGKIFVMPNGVSSRRFRNLTDSPVRLFPEDTLIIGFVGRFFPWQGVDILLQAVARRKDRYPFLRVVLIGDGPMEGPWKERVKSLQLENHVVFHPRVSPEEIQRFLQGLDVGYTGHRDPFRSPLKAYEYMAAGLPVLVSPTEDLQRYFRGTPGVWFFSPDDPGSLEASLEDIVQNRHQLSRMGQVLRERVLKEHSWRARVEGFLKWVEKRLPIQGIDGSFPTVNNSPSD